MERPGRYAPAFPFARVAGRSVWLSIRAGMLICANPQRANKAGDSTSNRQRSRAEQKRGAGAESVCPVNASGSFERFAASALSLSKLTTRVMAVSLYNSFAQ
jgi:hypothetical protein